MMTMTHTNEATQTGQTYVVYHGGSLYGLGRWSGPHATREEAVESQRCCRLVCGGDPHIRALDDDDTEK